MKLKMHSIKWKHHSIVMISGFWFGAGTSRGIIPFYNENDGVGVNKNYIKTFKQLERIVNE